MADYHTHLLHYNYIHMKYFYFLRYKLRLPERKIGILFRSIKSFKIANIWNFNCDFLSRKMTRLCLAKLFPIIPKDIYLSRDLTFTKSFFHSQYIYLPLNMCVMNLHIYHLAILELRDTKKTTSLPIH